MSQSVVEVETEDAKINRPKLRIYRSYICVIALTKCYSKTNYCFIDIFRRTSFSENLKKLK